MSSAAPEEFDVVVIGGGPGGSTAASLVAMHGHRTLLLEKERFPRYQIGESLLPATVHGICRLTGCAQALAQAGFTTKRGGTFRWGATPEPWSFSFSIARSAAGPTAFAYQVERMKFDQILLDNARRLGVEVRQECPVTGVIDSGDRVIGVRYVSATGQEREVHARQVVDASGHGSRVYSSVGGARQYSQFFRSLALFGYFRGGKRLPEPNSGNILSAAFQSGWFWYIPLSPTLTSVGAVVRRELASKVQSDPEQALRALIAECPIISEYLAGAERVTEGEYGQLRVRKDYSYHHTRFWRPGLALVGDAACFVDPVFSSGVHLATYSALLAARSINSVLAGTMAEQPAFEEFEARYRQEFGLFYEFLVAFYDMHVHEESYFWEAKKITSSSHPELESFVELVAGLNSGERALVSPEATAGRLAGGSRELASAAGQIAGNAESMMPLLRTTLLRDAMSESTQVVAQAMFGAEAVEKPLLDNGLVASPDGLQWVVPEAR
jgi:FAD-dependent halogenase